MSADELNYKNENEIIIHTFVLLSPLAHHKDIVIKNTFDCIQNGNSPITWSQISNKFINKFQTSGYITCVFSTLYPIRNADLQATYVWKVKPTEYFKHLLLYKDERFVYHAWWWYFVLNSQIWWYALQEEKIYVM